jgi:hypothetical protein
MHATPSSQLTTPSSQLTTPSSQLTTPSSRLTTPLTTPSSSLSEVPQPHKCIQLLLAPFHQGYTPGLNKPKAADYEGEVEKILLNTMHEYACLILTTDAFPDVAKQTQWAVTMWRAACNEVSVHYECTVHMTRLVRFHYYGHTIEPTADTAQITGQGCWARRFLKDTAWKNFKVFKFKEGSTEEIKHYNQDLWVSLLRDSTFHHKVCNYIIIKLCTNAILEPGRYYRLW